MNQKIKILKYSGMILVGILYLWSIFVFVERDIYYQWNIFFPEEYGWSWTRRVHYLKRIPLYLLEHLGGILYFITCLLYVKKKRIVSYVCGVISLVTILFCLRNDFPLFPRSLYRFRMNWGTDIMEYLYSAVYLGMFLFLIFFPVLCDFLQRYTQGKKILLGITGFFAISINLVSLLYALVCEKESLLNLSYTECPFLTAVVVIKIGLLFCLYIGILKKEELKQKKEEVCLKWIGKLTISIIIIAVLLFNSITVEFGGIKIPRKAEIDGYWYMGNVEGFIESYENPYQHKRHYLEFEFVKKEAMQEDEEGYEWEKTEGEIRGIKTYGRKLESVYYLDVITEQERLTSDRHPVDTYYFSTQYANTSHRDFRIVLSEEIYENTVFHYDLIVESTIDFAYDVIYDATPWGSGKQMYRKIELYDIAVDGKEIPAYFLGMVERFGVVKVEPFSHYWGENPMEKWCVSIQKLRPVRQY